MTIMATIICAAIAVYIGKALLDHNHQQKMQPIRIKNDSPTDRLHTKRRR
ncbi:hypothetical protein [Neptunomonas antarctica]|uniref:Uncharacterized protein n=1 Tax=Neptunomonas antarctica TaxID=619304 RepID=A0A1N7NP94_9GAMM|nr:hypothetical protein [Neptunomonas antarctica]SIT00142.1 hypothetical protein SAMN05421760_110109 [Neptunomonas antarctica]